MGHKVNPIGLRLGINRTWDSRWYAGTDYAQLLHDDLKLRAHLRKRLSGAGVSRVVIERPAKKPRVTIYAARPGVVIGKKGQDIEVLRKELQKMTKVEVNLNLVEIRKPEIDAVLVAENIAQQLERRVAFRRAMKRAVQSAMRLGAQGIRINCGGRLGGAEIARTEWYREGRVPSAHASSRHRFRHGHGEDHLRHVRREGMDLQGRDPGARPHGAGSPGGRAGAAALRTDEHAFSEADQVPQGP